MRCDCRSATAAPAAITVMAYTDMPAYPAVLAEAARAPALGGGFVHIGVYPCLCGGFETAATPLPW